VCTRSCNALAVEVPHPLQGVYRRQSVQRFGSRAFSEWGVTRTLDADRKNQRSYGKIPGKSKLSPFLLGVAKIARL
jgi:hypothetical protein